MSVFYYDDYERSKSYREQNIFRTKILSARRNHAMKVPCSIDYMTNILGWDLDEMVSDVRDLYMSGSCQMCGQKFRDLAKYDGDVNVITIDRVNLTLPPVYRLNTQWICFKDNNRKGRIPIEELIRRFISGRQKLYLPGFFDDELELA